LLQIAHLHERTALVISFDSSPELPAPQLAVGKTGSLEEFFSSLVALVRGPRPLKGFDGGAYFRNCWIEQKFPMYAFAAAIVLQALLIVFPPPIWNIRAARSVSAAPRTEIAWYGPVKDFPVILPAVRAPRATARKDLSKLLPSQGADAFHPRQNIFSEPLHPTHPRQTLVEPRAPLEPPKILPALPNIVQLAASQPDRPRLQITAKELTSLRPKTPSSLQALNVTAPEISTLEKQPGVINIASSSQAPAKPLLPVNPMSAPRAAQQDVNANVAAPDIRGRSGEYETLIALSATPAPVAPPSAIPAGNLSARISISPDGAKPGASGGTVSGKDAGGGHGPEGIFISGGDGANSSPISGLGFSRARIAPEGSKSLPADAERAALELPKLGLAPEKVLGSKRVYTLRVNMPNMTSASGSWILNFAEENEPAPSGYTRPDPSDLSGPALLKKVDPKYPPELRTSHVEGEVVLYAIIRKDGSVDSIQLVHSIDPQLDAYAMEALAQWKFNPAEKHGEPIDLEAVVHIPFRSRGPSF
jgi:TonB family protein